ncbi:MAG: winged helix-turn-helix transcriptional regulator [Candidatus Saganbacteria bacterium]|nr:winged helix-turn-helix transcriptional regulator [Candidatus Saganbacteria bacterium]
MVNENELKVIEEITKKGNLTQRELSSKTNLSLGAVNIIIKRLVTRGIIKTRGLTAKKAEYMVTPKGFSEKAKKTYNYMLKTVDLVKKVREEIAKLVLDEYNRGQRKFVILGNDDLADIIELALKGFDYRRVNSVEEIDGTDALVFVGKANSKLNGYRFINLDERLSQVYWGVD